MNTAEKLLEAYMYNDFYYKKSNTLRINQEGKITSQNTPMGYIVSQPGADEVYREFLVLTMQNYKSQPNWERQKKQLAHAANNMGMTVIFKWLDIFAEQIEVTDNKYLSSGNYHDQCYKDLITVAKYSQDPDVKTAAMCRTNEKIFDGKILEDVLLYSYNQEINGQFVHAEKALCDYLSTIGEKSLSFVTMLEPCKNCLESMIDNGAEIIDFAHLHKEKWNTPEFIDYTNSIFNKTIRSERNRAIDYKRVQNKKVESFYDRSKKKFCIINHKLSQCSINKNNSHLKDYSNKEVNK